MQCWIKRIKSKFSFGLEPTLWISGIGRPKGRYTTGVSHNCLFYTFVLFDFYMTTCDWPMIIWPYNRITQHLEISIFPKLLSPAHCINFAHLFWSPFYFQNLGFVQRKSLWPLIFVFIFFLSFLPLSCLNVIWHGLQSSLWFPTMY